ncbi:hypothetical protein BpHYR1_008599 [Brachionus plicatilis]|uniref:Uncharacterized protein n=1 Tax=Brachionus plicatilis TaxID=10195 RepID=A0A3M7PQX3_BRAPC|nr:hypothetical protein BpHYR1_008599 [Brachionus plicatilis]
MNLRAKLISFVNQTNLLGPELTESSNSKPCSTFIKISQWVFAGKKTINIESSVNQLAINPFGSPIRITAVVRSI